MPMKFVTIKDIAKKLGIDHSTVSRAINNEPGVSAVTRRRVMEMVKEMEYVPNMAARGLARAKSNTIAVVSYSYFSTFAVELMRGIEAEMLNTKYEMLYYSTSMYTFIGTEGRDVYIYEKILNEKKADALIVFSGILYGKKNITERYKKAGIHLIFIEGQDTRGSRVHYDNAMAAGMAVRHLKQRNRKKIGMLIGNTIVVQSFKERKQGYLKAFEPDERRDAEANIYEFTEFTSEMAVSAFNFFVRNGIDAVYVAVGDEFALNLIKEARKAGLRVPEDMAIVGQDDTIAAYAADITTIRQPIVQMGRKAVEIAVRALGENDPALRDEMFYPELVVRKTT
jgi:DNA-binding LacI/PurR family transcriptional regulator